MGRSRRFSEIGFSYHVTVRCNDRRFLLRDPRVAGVYRGILARYQRLHHFTLYAFAIMDNHVHLVIRPAPDGGSLSKIMHDINWYSAMCLNRMLGRTGHFWESRYHSVPFRDESKRVALGTLSYVHANPKTAGIVGRLSSWRRSDYRHYLGLEPEPLTTLHPAFVALATTALERSFHYRKWAERPRRKSAPSNAESRTWGRKRFPVLNFKRRRGDWNDWRQTGFPWQADEPLLRDDVFASDVLGPELAWAFAGPPAEAESTLA